MLKLSQTKQYQKDIKKFQQGIAKLTKPTLKTEYEQILKDRAATHSRKILIF